MEKCGNKDRRKDDRRNRVFLPGMGVPQKAVDEFTRSFAVMIHARLSITQALANVITQCKQHRLKRTLEDILNNVQRGRSLSESLSMHPSVFSALYIHLTAVGEVAGILDQTLIRLAGYLEKTTTLKRKIKLAMLYPGIITFVALGASVFMLTAIVPTFSELFVEFGADLPGPTRFVMRLSALFSAYFWVFILLIVSICFGWVLFKSSNRGAFFWDLVRLKMPLVGGLYHKNLIAGFCRTLGTLLVSGIPLVDALEITSKVGGNRVMEQEITRIQGRVRRGRSLNQLMEKGGLFPDMVVQMIAVGEQTAELDGMLIHVADYYEKEVEAYVETIMSIIEPIFIVMIGLLLGGMLVALYLPMFDLITVVG